MKLDAKVSEYLEKQDSNTTLAMALYPYVHNGELSYADISDMLHIPRLNLIDIYSSSGISYVKQTKKEILSDLTTLRNLEK